MGDHEFDTVTKVEWHDKEVEYLLEQAEIESTWIKATCHAERSALRLVA